MESFLQNFDAGNASFSRRQADIEGINQAGVENYNALKMDQDANYNALKGNINASNNAVKTQTGVEEGFAGVGMEPLVKSGMDYGAKSLYAAGKQAKAARLGTRAQALQEGDTAGVEATENPGMLETTADVMDSELAQNIAAVAKAPGQLVSKAGELAGDAGKAIGKAVYRGGQRVVQNIRGAQRNRGEAEDEGTELDDVEASGVEDTGRLPNLGLRGGSGSRDIAEQAAQGQEQIVANPEQAEAISGISDAARGEPSNIAEGVVNRQPTASLAQKVQQQKTDVGSQAESDARLESAGDQAQAESETLVNSAGNEVTSAAAGAGEAGAAGAGEAGAGAAAAAADAGAATGGEIAADAAAAGLDAAAAASEAVPGIGTVVGGLLALGGGLAALFGGHKAQKKAPPPPPPPPKPTQLGQNISEAAPVMDSSIFRATGYNQLA